MSVVASLPQNTHLPFVPDWCSGIQREETPAFSFMPSSHSRLPHHIEFRYGTDIESLSEFCTGKYAYWMAAGVLESSDSEQQESIRIFVEENTSQD